jgi:hypothetical protein
VNNIKTHLLARPLGCFLAILMAFTSSYLMFGLSSHANAQEATGNPSWAVLDFVNNSGYGGSEIGHEAADALDVELYNTKQIEVVKRSDIADAIAHYGLSDTLDLLDMQRVGRYVEAKDVVSGEVLTVSRSGKDKVEVTIAVRVNDVETGELINGALARGTAVSRAGGIDEDAMVNEAISKAVLVAVSRIQKYTLPIATVVGFQGDSSVILNKGSRDGYFVGLPLMTMRNGKESGKLRISSIQSDSSYATVVNTGIGVQPQDRCHALYKMAPYQVVHNRVISPDPILADTQNFSQHRAKFSKLGGILIAILAAALLIYLVKRGSSNGSLGGAYVGSVVAQACNALINSVASSSTTENGVRISWGYGNLSYMYIDAFNVYRNPTGTFSSGGGGASSSIGSVSVSGSTSGTTSAGLTTYANVPVACVGNTQRVANDDSEALRYVTFEYVYSGYSNGSGSSGSSSSVGGIVLGVLAAPATLPVTGVTMANPYQYAVTAVYSVYDGVSGTTGAEETPVTSGMANGYATPLLMVDNNYVLVNGTAISSAHLNVTATDLASVTIAWNETAGADSYILDVATNRTFTNKKTYSITGSGIAGVQQKVQNLNLATLFGSTPQYIFFRIGARSSTDKPGPYADSNKFPNPDTNPNGGNYLYNPYCLLVVSS